MDSSAGDGSKNTKMREVKSRFRQPAATKGTPAASATPSSGPPGTSSRADEARTNPAAPPRTGPMATADTVGGGAHVKPWSTAAAVAGETRKSKSAEEYHRELQDLFVHYPPRTTEADLSCMKEEHRETMREAQDLAWKLHLLATEDAYNKWIAQHEAELKESAVEIAALQEQVAKKRYQELLDTHAPAPEPGLSFEESVRRDKESVTKSMDELEALMERARDVQEKSLIISMVNTYLR